MDRWLNKWDQSTFLLPLSEFIPLFRHFPPFGRVGNYLLCTTDALSCSSCVHVGSGGKGHFSNFNISDLNFKWTVLPLVLQGEEGAGQVSWKEQSEFPEYKRIKTGGFLSSEDENEAPPISPQSSRLPCCAHLNLWRFHQCDCVSLIRQWMCGT